jgi:hypothetical protein
MERVVTTDGRDAVSTIQTRIDQKTDCRRRSSKEQAEEKENESK